MTLSITHTKVSGIADVGDASLVEPSDWNASHTLTGTVSVAQGGTGTGTAFTAGSVVFAGASGVYSQDNAKFFWDDTNFILKAGTEIDLLVNGAFAKAVYPIYNATATNWYFGGAGGITGTGAGNTGIGNGALASLTTGFYNVGIGVSAGLQMTSATFNMAIGQGSLFATTTGGSNVGIGHLALSTNVSNSANVAIGDSALASANGGDFNTSIGNGSGFAITTGFQNVQIGANVTGHVGPTTGNYNTILGTNAGGSLAAGSANTIIGAYSAANVTGGDNNVYIGANPGTSAITGGSNNTLIGGWAGPAGTLSSAIALSDGAGNLKLDYNYSASGAWTFPSNGINMLVNAVSKPALYPVYNASGNNWFTAESGNATTTGNKNMGMGTVALLGLTSGSNNAAIGGQALQNCSSGSGNVAVGTNALNAVSTQNNNCGIGANTFQSVAGSDNVGVGTNAFQACTSGSGNVGIGSAVAYQWASGSNNVVIGNSPAFNVTSGSNNTLIGNWIGATGAMSSVIALSDGAGALKLDYGYTNAGTWTSPAAICVTPVAVASLPSASIVGLRHFVTDATATTFASIVAGSGANKVPVYSDGTNWRIG